MIAVDIPTMKVSSAHTVARDRFMIAPSVRLP